MSAMKKLTLDLEGLRIKSFATTLENGPGNGTVIAACDVDSSACCACTMCSMITGCELNSELL